MQHHKFDLSKRLARYSAAAGIALTTALTLPAQSTNTAPQWHDINPDRTLDTHATAVAIDFDQDSDVEFAVIFLNNLTEPWVYVRGNSSGSDVGTAFNATMLGPYAFAKANVTSSSIGPDDNWVEPPPPFATLGWGSLSGNFPGQGNRFLGLRFTLDGDTSTQYYGWVYLEVAPDSSTVTVRSYGYDDAGGAAHPPSDPSAVSFQQAHAAAPGAWLLPATALSVVTGLFVWLRKRLFGHRA